MSFDGIREKRKTRVPGIIDKFLANPEQDSMPLDLYPREIKRYSYKYPKLIIVQEEKYENMDIWKCTLRKKEE